MLINIAPLGKVEFSSTSKWTTKDDTTEILTFNHGRNYSFHTDLEDSPYVIIDLQKKYKVEKIRVTNRFGSSNHSRAKTLKIEGSLTKEFLSEPILKSCENWHEIIDVSLTGQEIRYLKFSLNETNYFHLRLIEIFVDSDNLYNSDSQINDRLGIIKFASSIMNKDAYCYVNDEAITNVVFYNFVTKYYNWLPGIKFRLDMSMDNPVFYIELSISQSENFSCFSKFLFSICKKNNLVLSYKNNMQIAIIKNSNICSLECQIKQLFNHLFETVVPAYGALVENITTDASKREAHRPLVIIDVDKITNGFADKFKGTLSIIECCQNIGLDYVIKFNKPFKFSKYYYFKVFDKDIASLTNYCDLGTLHLSSLESLEGILQSVRDTYDYIIISSYTNVFTKKETYAENFIRTPFLSNELSKYKQIIGGNYISISFRFVNSLGDFKDPSSFNQTLPDKEQNLLMQKCKNELIKFIENKKNNQKFLVLSDSSKFLNYIKEIPNVYVFTENIAHVGAIKIISEDSEKLYVKTLIDFNLIIDALETYRFETEHLYRTGFPIVAAKCAGRETIVHKF